MNRITSLLVVAVLTTLSAVSCAEKEPRVQTVPPPPPPSQQLAFSAPEPAPGANCDATLWDHVYHGQKATAKDRLKVLNPCTTVTGTIIDAAQEDDGDWHIRVQIDSQYAGMLNAYNNAGDTIRVLVQQFSPTALSDVSLQLLREALQHHWPVTDGGSYRCAHVHRRREAHGV